MAFIDLFVKSEEQGQTNEAPVNNKRNYTSGTSRADVDNSGSPTLAVAQAVGNAGVPQQKTPMKSISADEEIVNKIWDKIIAANRPGPDYLELKNNVEALEESGLSLSNDQKLIASFNVLKKGYPNFQKDDITKAIDFYINVVNGEKEAGLKQLDELRISNVDGAENEIQTMQNKAEELKRQYDEIQASIASKTLEVTQAKSDIDMKYNTFVSSVDAVMNVLEKDKENILAINF